MYAYSDDCASDGELPHSELHNAGDLKTELFKNSWKKDIIMIIKSIQLVINKSIIRAYT